MIKSKQSAFTIVELIVVIVVIGILATISIASYGLIQSRAATETLKLDIQKASSQIALYKANTGGYPATGAEVDDGKGLSKSTDTTYQYTKSGSTYCLDATSVKSGNTAFHTSSSANGSVETGYCPYPVADGLIMNLDAGNVASYPGTGTTWYDLSGNNKNGTLLNGVGYTSANSGALSFDGVNDVINLGTGNTFFPLPNFSMELWFKSNGTTPTTGTSPGLLGITYGINLTVSSSALQFWQDNGTTFVYLNSIGTYSFYNSSWHQVVIQANSTTMYMYIDGLFSNTLGTIWSGTTRWPTNSTNLGRGNNNPTEFFTGNIASTRFYNRVLSASEIKRNFDTFRGRYGI